MAETPRRKLGAADRLRKAADYRRVFREGTRVEGRLLGLVGAQGRTGWLRLGLAASRRVGGAVARNRVKRLVRESFRSERRDLALDVVAVPKPTMLACGLTEVAAEFRRLLERLRRRLDTGRREKAASPAD